MGELYPCGAGTERTVGSVNKVQVVYTRDGVSLTLNIPDKHDPFKVMEKTLKMMFPDASDKDLRYEEMMKKRKK